MYELEVTKGMVECPKRKHKVYLRTCFGACDRLISVRPVTGGTLKCCYVTPVKTKDDIIHQELVPDS